VIRVYRAPWSTNCERVALALAHKGLEVESVVVDYSDRSEVEAVSGQGLVPVIVEGDEVVADSVRIMRHLDERHPGPRLFPPEDPARVHCELFCEWFNEVWKVAPNALEAELTRDDPDEEVIAALASRMESHLDVFERMLAAGDYLSAEFSAADCAAYPFLKYAAGRDPADDELFHVILDERQSVEGRPRLAAWIERMASHPRAF
jgi:glutathione S-transferase